MTIKFNTSALFDKKGYCIYRSIHGELDRGSLLSLVEFKDRVRRSGRGFPWAHYNVNISLGI